MSLLFADHFCSTEVAGSIPIANTGKVRLELRKSGGASVAIPIKGSIVMTPGEYEVIAHPTGGAPPVLIAGITYDVKAFKVGPTIDSVKDARFAVYVNVSEQ